MIAEHRRSSGCVGFKQGGWLSLSAKRVISCRLSRCAAGGSRPSTSKSRLSQLDEEYSNSSLSRQDQCMYVRYVMAMTATPLRVVANMHLLNLLDCDVPTRNSNIHCEDYFMHRVADIYIYSSLL